MKSYAVVVNWNGGPDNEECLRSLVEQGLPQDRILFVDNGSTDGSLESVTTAFPDLLVTRNASNLGFGEAANQGAITAMAHGADAVFFVNNDVVLPPGVLGALEAYLEANPGVGVVGPRVLYRSRPDTVWCAGGMMTWRENLSTLLGHGRPDGPRWQETRDVDYVAGCAMLARSPVLKKAGLLDAAFFAYMEDVDFCLRVKDAGYRVVMLGEQACLHETSSATGGGYNPRRKYMMGVNSIWFLRRHGRLRHWLRFLVFDVLTLPILWVLALFRGRSRAVLAKGLGILDGLLGKRVTAERIKKGAGALW